MSLLVDDVAQDAVIVDAIRRARGRGSQPQLSTLEFAARYRQFEQPIPAFHEVWYQALDGPDQRLVLVAPREHAKTSVVLTYALHRVVRDRQARVGIISGTDDLARAFLRELQNELRWNRNLIADFGGRFFVQRSKWTEHELVIAGSRHGKDVSVFCASVGSQVAGRHCDLLIFDDVETTDSVSSPEMRAKTKAWVAKEALPLLSPGGKAVVIGTRKHEDDLYGTLIRSAQGHTEGSAPWRYLDNALAVFDDEEAPIWPERWSRDALLRRKAELDTVDVTAWPQEYLNRVLPSETQMFRPNEWPTYTVLPDNVRHFQAWDLAISLKEAADYTAGVDIAIDDANNVYLVDCVFGRWDFHAQQLSMVSFYERYRPELVGIEAVQYQAAAIQELARTSMLPVLRIHPSGKGLRGKTSVPRDKVGRARLFEARAAEHKVLRPTTPGSWWPELYEEATWFPLGRHDDLVDALAYAFKMAARQGMSWARAYDIYTCTGCGHMYVLHPISAAGVRYDRDDRPCPKCWAPPQPSAETDLYEEEAG